MIEPLNYCSSIIMIGGMRIHLQTPSENRFVVHANTVEEAAIEIVKIIRTIEK